MASRLNFLLILILLCSEVSFATSEDVRFSRGTLKIGGQTLRVEVARTDRQLEHGLMFRKELPDGEGMIFIFSDERPRAFWMKNTFVDLSIGYFDRNRKLVDKQNMQAVKSVMEKDPPSYPSKAPAMYALEVPQGWFDKHKIGLGAQFSLEEKADKRPGTRQKTGP